MSIEFGAGFGDRGSGVPAPESIRPDDCTLALIAASRVEVEPPLDLGDRILESRPGSTSYDCRACFAKLTDSGFRNIVGSVSCQALFRQEAETIITEN